MSPSPYYAPGELVDARHLFESQNAVIHAVSNPEASLCVKSCTVGPVQLGFEGIFADLFSSFLGNAGDKVDLAGFWRVEPNAMIHVVSDDEIPSIIEAEMLWPVDQGILGRAAIAGIALFAGFRNDRVNVAQRINFANRVSVSRCDVNNPVRSVAGGAR